MVHSALGIEESQHSAQTKENNDIFSMGHQAFKYIHLTRSKKLRNKTKQTCALSQLDKWKINLVSIILQCPELQKDSPHTFLSYGVYYLAFKMKPLMNFRYSHVSWFDILLLWQDSPRKPQKEAGLNLNLQLWRLLSFTRWAHVPHLVRRNFITVKQK